jgi:hypothetical protein
MVLASEHDRSNGPLDGVVVEIDAALVEEAREFTQRASA